MRSFYEMNYAILSASALVLFGMGASVNKVVRSPYMDEVFHVPQAQKYCHGDYGKIKCSL